MYRVDLGKENLNGLDLINHDKVLSNIQDPIDRETALKDKSIFYLPASLTIISSMKICDMSYLNTKLRLEPLANSDGNYDSSPIFKYFEEDLAMFTPYLPINIYNSLNSFSKEFVKEYFKRDKIILGDDAIGYHEDVIYRDTISKYFGVYRKKFKFFMDQFGYILRRVVDEERDEIRRFYILNGSEVSVLKNYFMGGYGIREETEWSKWKMRICYCQEVFLYHRIDQLFSCNHYLRVTRTLNNCFFDKIRAIYYDFFKSRNAHYELYDAFF